VKQGVTESAGMRIEDNHMKSVFYIALKRLELKDIRFAEEC